MCHCDHRRASEGARFVFTRDEGCRRGHLVGAYPVTPIVLKPHQPHSLCDCLAGRSGNFPVSRIQAQEEVTLDKDDGLLWEMVV